MRSTIYSILRFFGSSKIDNEEKIHKISKKQFSEFLDNYRKSVSEVLSESGTKYEEDHFLISATGNSAVIAYGATTRETNNGGVRTFVTSLRFVDGDIFAESFRHPETKAHISGNMVLDTMELAYLMLGDIGDQSEVKESVKWYNRKGAFAVYYPGLLEFKHQITVCPDDDGLVADFRVLNKDYTVQSETDNCSLFHAAKFGKDLKRFLENSSINLIDKDSGEVLYEDKTITGLNNWFTINGFNVNVDHTSDMLFDITLLSCADSVKDLIKNKNVAARLEVPTLFDY